LTASKSYPLSYELSMDEYKDLAQKTRKAILPIGAQEAHGKHLPLNTDSIIAFELAREASRITGALLLPLLPYGHVRGLRNFAGSISLSETVLKQIIKEIAKSLYKDGIDRLYVVNGNIPNAQSIDAASEEMAPKIKIFNLTFPGASEIYEKFCDSKQWHPGIFHAEEIETSLMLYLKPELVKIGSAVASYPEKPVDFGVRYIQWEEFNKLGIIGDPTKADAKKGEMIFRFILNNIVNIINKT